MYYLPVKKQLNSQVNTLLIDKNQQIWVGDTHGLSKFVRESGTFEKFAGQQPDPLDQTQVTGIEMDSFGSVWLATLDKGLFKYEERALFTSYIPAWNQKHTLTTGWANVIGETKVLSHNMFPLSSASIPCILIDGNPSSRV